MIKNRTELNADMQRELNGKKKKAYIISLIIGTAGILAYLFLSVIYDPTPLWVYAFLVFAVPFTIGLIFLLTLNKLQKTLPTTKTVNEYEIEDGFMHVTTIKNGENIGTVKVYFREINKTKETPHYIFLYLNQGSAFPIRKDGLTRDDLEEIKRRLNVKSKD